MPYIYKSGLQFGTHETNIFIGTDGTNPGTSGLVPAPSTTDRNKYLKSDGTWAIPAGGGTGGTSDYEELTNLPSINNQILLGNVELNELGLGNFITTFVLDLFYPIGSYYETSDTSFDPNTAWGGTWELEESGRVHVSAGTGYAIGSKGGSKDAIIPYHNHSVSASSGAITGGSHAHDIYYRTKTNIGSGSAGWWVLGSATTHSGSNSNTIISKSHSHDLPAHNTNYAGSSGNTTNANMQPYIVVNRWHRTA